MIETQPERWPARQILADPAGDHDWGISAVSQVDPTSRGGRPTIAGYRYCRQVSGSDRLLEKRTQYTGEQGAHHEYGPLEPCHGALAYLQ